MNADTPLLLFGETFSPWTKKARWALEYCDLAYDYREYTPSLSEPGLRLRLRQMTGTVSVPLMFAGSQVLRESWDIADYAARQRGDGRLGDMIAIKPWNDLSEAALAQGRTQVVRRILNNPQALEEGLPNIIPQKMRGPLRFMAYDAVRRLDKKYAHLLKPGSLRTALLKTQEGLSQSGSDYLLGDFSYADMVMAAVVEVIAPLARHDPPLGPATQKCWQDKALAEEFDDLLAWRDRLAAAPATSYSQFRSEA